MNADGVDTHNTQVQQRPCVFANANAQTSDGEPRIQLKIASDLFNEQDRQTRCDSGRRHPVGNHFEIHRRVATTERNTLARGQRHEDACKIAVAGEADIHFAINGNFQVVVGQVEAELEQALQQCFRVDDVVKQSGIKSWCATGEQDILQGINRIRSQCTKCFQGDTRCHGNSLGQERQGHSCGLAVFCFTGRRLFNNNHPRRRLIQSPPELNGLVTRTIGDETKGGHSGETGAGHAGFNFRYRAKNQTIANVESACHIGNSNGNAARAESHPVESDRSDIRYRKSRGQFNGRARGAGIQSDLHRIRATQ